MRFTYKGKNYIWRMPFWALCILTVIVMLAVCIYPEDICKEPEKTQIYEYKAEDVGTAEKIAEPTCLGEFEITYYCSCEQCCGKSDGITASGAPAIAGETIAVDPDVIPLGTEVVIDGETYIAEDTGAVIEGNRIDIYCDSHEEALELGRTTAEVSIW